MIKAIFPATLNEMIKTGIGAIHNRYQKSPLNPLEKYQHNPEKIIPATTKALPLDSELIRGASVIAMH